MQMAKRVFLFLATNILVMVSLSIVLRLLGFEGYLSARGIDYQQLMIFCLVWGMGGAFVSLAISRWMAKRSMGVIVIDPKKASGFQAELVERVHRLARSAGLTTMPEVGYYESPELNAFATGPTRNRSLVAVSTGLLSRMNHNEVEGVLAHEIAHVANGDMVTLTLVQGVVNAFVMFLARVAAFAVSQVMRKDDEDSGPSPFVQHMIVMAFEMVFMIFGTMVVAAFSRWREFRADAGSARIAGRDAMIAALEKLRQAHGIQDPHTDVASVSAMKISGRGSWMALFSTHPPLEARIARLQGMRSV